MVRIRLFIVLGLALIRSGTFGQVQRNEVPLGDTLTEALAKSSLTGDGAHPFHIRVEISEPENPQSPYQGILEAWWISPDKWRRVVTSKDGTRQTIVVVDGKKTEEDEGDYFPVWLRNFVTAVFDPVPDTKSWVTSGLKVEQTVGNGFKSNNCARAKSNIGSAGRDSTVYFAVCFDEQGRLSLVVTPGYSMEFHDYQAFGEKQIARKLVSNPESGTTLVGSVNVLEGTPTGAGASELFAPLPADEDKFQAVQVSADTMQNLIAGNPPVVWPTLRSGNVRGRVAIYISTDTKGQVRETWPINADAGVDDSLREQARKWTIKPAVDKAGKPVQVDGPISFAYETRIENPFPQLSDAETRQLVTKMVDPVWPKSVHPGQVIEANISVNEQGKLAGAGFSHTTAPPDALIAVMNALHQWAFRPLIREGKPQYFHGTVRFVVR